MQVSPNRSSLLLIKKRIALAKKGKSLLKKKQDVLIGKLFSSVKELEQKRDQLHETLKQSELDFVRSLALTGNFIARSAMYGSPDNFTVHTHEKSIMGVSVPDMRVDSKNLPYTYESPLLVNAARQHEIIIKELISISSLETTIQNVAEEIKKTKRRVNSLENIQIPKMEKILASITLTLEEQDRESFIRLKHIKKQLAKES